jgi:hypothetical protein
MFHFGPSFFLGRVRAWQRLEDAQASGRTFHCIAAEIRPGLGEAERDWVELWLDPSTHRLFRIHTSLNGFETTQGAHVDTTFLAYREVAGFTLPVSFHERVRGPLRIDAHTWWTTGLDADRGWTVSDVSEDGFKGAAAAPAKPTAVP